MKKSKFENIGNAQLFFLLKLTLKNLNGDTPDMSEDYTIIAIDEAASTVGLNTYFPIDHNYVVSCLSLNIGYDFETKSPSGPLKRPVASLYSFEYDEHRTEYIRRTYRHTITSYSDDVVGDTIRAVDYQGFDYYDGELVDEDSYDGETTDSGLDISSIKKIKQ